ncbi:glutaredoxin 3 [Pseudomonas aeruginosa]|uniref:glutaredoxin 3 n=1 Tax=Pseudomonas aeruginosa TaxID=287 RepID=UPI001C9464D2|nr:glutaredoxin 3 [Pseudomonas aeruginosa]WAJ81435.1 glutaredoxin 3 [Pseudomonas aeruginosa]HBO1414542.1 glutaredoxin 3 [Pseudomonas aeruginosa]HBO3807453.1 glutaredoxin 3 [Pseudomonas aeruginosa]HBO7425078.1 glutaredoxin 3 [Pseudomonas aeruginosa]HCL3529995.1 glutaredoxin 3 [Pseudomonas aeruginosa]
MSQIIMYTSQHCPYCRMAEQLLVRRAAGPLTKVRVDLDSLALISMIAKTGRRTVPQIFIGDRHVGGYDDLARLDAAGELSSLLAACQ